MAGKAGSRPAVSQTEGRDKWEKLVDELLAALRKLLLLVADRLWPPSGRK